MNPFKSDNNPNPPPTLEVAHQQNEALQKVRNRILIVCALIFGVPTGLAGLVFLDLLFGWITMNFIFDSPTPYFDGLSFTAGIICFIVIVLSIVVISVGIMLICKAFFYITKPYREFLEKHQNDEKV